MNKQSPDFAKQILSRFHAKIKTGKYDKFLINLYSRWQCEREYEDFNDYVSLIIRTLSDDFTVTQVTKRPFGIRVLEAGFNLKLDLLAKGNYIQLRTSFIR